MFESSIARCRQAARRAASMRGAFFGTASEGWATAELKATSSPRSAAAAAVSETARARSGGGGLGLTLAASRYALGVKRFRASSCPWFVACLTCAQKLAHFLRLIAFAHKLARENMGGAGGVGCLRLPPARSGSRVF